MSKKYLPINYRKFFTDYFNKFFRGTISKYFIKTVVDDMQAEIIHIAWFFKIKDDERALDFKLSRMILGTIFNYKEYEDCFKKELTETGDEFIKNYAIDIIKIVLKMNEAHLCTDCQVACDYGKMKSHIYSCLDYKPGKE